MLIIHGNHGQVAKWFCNGLQSRQPRFDSGPGLQRTHMNVTLTGLDEFTSNLTDLQKRQIPFALARALTKLGQIGAKATQADINANVDSPTPFTQRAGYSEGPTTGTPIVKKGDTSVIFGVRPIQAEYLDAQYFGGSSALRPFETRFEGRHVIPTSGAPKDQFGNVPRAYIQQVLGDAKAKKNGYYMTKTAVRYRPKGGDSVKLFDILDKAPTYKPQLSLDEAIEKVVDAWPSAFNEALDDALRTARP
jgi:hypothetical protein